MLMNDLLRSVAPAPALPARHLVAALLSSASLALGRLASRLLHVEKQPAGEPVLEFYADAGAPEGALYVNGELVARLSGVNRL